MVEWRSFLTTLGRSLFFRYYSCIRMPFGLSPVNDDMNTLLSQNVTNTFEYNYQKHVEFDVRCYCWWQLFTPLRQSIFFFSANTDKKVGGLLLLRGSTKIHLVFNMIAAKMMLPKILLWQPFCILLVQPCRQYLYDNYKSYHCKAESRCFYHSYYAWKVACFFQNSVPFLRVEWNYILHFRSPYPVLLYLLWSLASTYNCK